MGLENQFLVFLYPATKVWRGIMLYPSVSVRPSVRPSVRAHHFRSITWVFIHGIFSNFAYILLSAMSGMGLLMGKIRPFLTELLPFFVSKNGFWPVIPLLFMITEWNFTDMLHIKGYILWLKTVTLTFPVCELSALDRSEKWFLTYFTFTMWNIWI